MRWTKYSSWRAAFSSSTATSMSGSRPTRRKTSSATSRMTLALGSKFLYTLCPNPNIFSFLSLTRFKKAGIASLFPMRASIFSTASLAPPCSGP